jgi:hypothetical protein
MNFRNEHLGSARGSRAGDGGSPSRIYDYDYEHEHEHE